MKVGEYRYVLKGARRIFFIKGKLHIPLIGFLNRNPNRANKRYGET
jgi:hypothetical protein